MGSGGGGVVCGCGGEVWWGGGRWWGVDFGIHPIQLIRNQLTTRNSEPLELPGKNKFPRGREGRATACPDPGVMSGNLIFHVETGAQPTGPKGPQKYSRTLNNNKEPPGSARSRQEPPGAARSWQELKTVLSEPEKKQKHKNYGPVGAGGTNTSLKKTVLSGPGRTNIFKKYGPFVARKSKSFKNYCTFGARK